MSSNWESFWDRAFRAGDHLRHWEGEPASPVLAALVAAGVLRAGTRVVDVGCGGGLEALYLAGLGFPVIAVDASEVALELARGRAAAAGLAVDWRHGDARRLPLADGEAGFALDRGCFHVVDPDDRALYAAEMARVLVPGGRLLLHGARAGEDEEGLVAVDAAEVDRWFPPPRFVRGPLVPLPLTAPAGALAANLVLLERL
ncbi:MAG TPA: class I SAM-dependent methyltransferase [Thermoanaerobaculia bacterium]|nr:class I SAM-dependent methyltransferase [Thermoanaerobaculia bacterium]